MRFDLLRQCESMIALAHQLLYLSDVVFGPLILLFFDQHDVSSTVVVAHMLDEISAVANLLSL